LGEWDGPLQWLEDITKKQSENERASGDRSSERVIESTPSKKPLSNGDEREGSDERQDSNETSGMNGRGVGWIENDDDDDEGGSQLWEWRRLD
jgi:hypothetical protein